jgi:hypothetical protein
MRLNIKEIRKTQETKKEKKVQREQGRGLSRIKGPCQIDIELPGGKQQRAPDNLISNSLLLSVAAEDVESNIVIS